MSASRASPRPAFDLPAEQRAIIQNALNETFSAEIRVRFETAPNLVCGIELTTNGQKVAWSIAEYLASLEKSIGEFLDAQSKPEAKAEPKPEPQSDESKPDPEPEPKQEVKPKAKPEPTPEPKSAAPVEAK